jgi:hypothetical protein
MGTILMVALTVLSAVVVGLTVLELLNVISIEQAAAELLDGDTDLALLLAASATRRLRRGRNQSDQPPRST